MAINWRGLGLMFVAKNMASSVIGQLERDMRVLGTTSHMVGRSMAGAYIGFKGFQAGAAILKGAFGLAEGAGKFQEKLGYLAATAEATDNQMMQMREKAQQIGLTTVFDPSAAVEGMTALAAQGLSAAQSIDMVTDSLRLAGISLGRMSTESAGEFMAAIMKMFPSEKDANRIANIAAQVARKSAVSIEKLPSMFSRLQRGAMFNQSLTESAASLAIVKNVVKSPEMASTALGSIFSAFTEGKKQVKFEAMTGVSIKNAQGQFRPFLTIMAEMAKSPLWNRLEQGVKSEFLLKMFGKYQMAAVDGTLKAIANGIPDVNGQIYKGVEGMRKFVQTMEEAQGQNVLGEFEERQINTFGGLLKLLQAKASTFKDTMIGEGFADAFRPMVSFFNRALEMGGLIFSRIPPEVQAAVGAIVTFGGALLAVTAIGGMLAAIISGVVFLFTGPLGAVAGAIAAGLGFALFKFIVIPLIIISGLIAALTVVGAGLFAAWKANIGGFRDLFGGFFQRFMLGFQAFKMLLMNNGMLTEGMYKSLKGQGNEGVLAWVVKLWMWLTRLKNFAMGIWDGFKKGLQDVDGPLHILMQTFRQLLNVFSVSTGTADGNRRAFAAWGDAGRNLGRVLSYLANVGILLLSAIVGLVTAAMSAVKWIYGVMGSLEKMGALMNVGMSMMPGSQVNFWDAYGQYSKLRERDAAEAGPEPAANGPVFTGQDLLRTYTDDSPAAIEARRNKQRRMWGGAAHPGLSAQAATGVPTPAAPAQPAVLNLQTHNVFQIGSQKITEVYTTEQRSLDSRSFQPVPAIPWGVER